MTAKTRISEIKKTGVRQSGENWCIVGFESGLTALAIGEICDFVMSNVGKPVEVAYETSKSKDGRFDNNVLASAKLIHESLVKPVAPAVYDDRREMIWAYAKDVCVALIYTGMPPDDAADAAVQVIVKIKNSL